MRAVKVDFRTSSVCVIVRQTYGWQGHLSHLIENPKFNGLAVSRVHEWQLLSQDMAPSKKGSSRKKGKGAGMPDTTASIEPSSNTVVGAAAVVVVGVLLIVGRQWYAPTTVESGESGTLRTAPHC